MKTVTRVISSIPALLTMALYLWFTPSARAGLTFELHIVRFEHGQAYKFFTPLYTNSIGANAPLGNYFIYSPFYSLLQPTNGSWRELQVTADGVTTLDGTENPYPDFNSVMNQITNGTWTMIFTNTTTTNTYTFKVSASNMTSNMLPATAITYPTDNELNIPNQPTFTWLGPTNASVYTTNTYVVNYDSSFYFFANGLPSTQGNWTPPGIIPNGMNCTFYLDYQTNSSPVLFASTTPTDTHSQPFSGWSSTDIIETGDSVAFAVTNPPVASPILVAHYTFDDGNNLGADSSGNGYDLDFNGGDGVTVTNDLVSGSGAAYFDGNSFFSYNSTPTNVLNALAGDFSLSFWIKTTQDDGNENGPAWAGDGIVTADIPGGYNDLVPAALDGGEIGFNTGGPYGDDTVNSTTDINNDNNYHHVVITRDEATGEKDIYIDGVLNNSDFATLNPLSDPRLVAIGCAIDASQSDPNSASPDEYFQGSLDDLQLYAGVLSADQVAYLHNYPGAIVVGSGLPQNLVTNGGFETGDLTGWTLFEDGGGISADNGSSLGGSPHSESYDVAFGTVGSLGYLSQTLSTTPGATYLLSFWLDSPNGSVPNEFQVSWDGTILFDETDLPALGWTNLQFLVTATGSSTVLQFGGQDDPSYLGLDDVSVTLTQPGGGGGGPVITLNPFDQTNYPGYLVWLSASATSNPTATWQWYEVGSGAISTATNSYFIPANSGSAGVEGQYYAIASNNIGSANTTTASVTFVSAPLPPDWSRAFKSPFGPASSVSDLTQDYYYGCIVDASGNIYAAAEFGGNMLIGSTYLNSGTGGDAAAVVKQSPTGSALWAAGITNNGNGSSFAENVALTPGEGVYVAGNYFSTNWLGTNQLTDAGGGDMFLACFNANGSNLWVKTFGGTNADFMVINSLASDPSGNVTFSGLLGSGPVTIGTSNYTVVGQQGILIQLDQTGAVRWSQLLPPEWVQYLTYSAGRLYASLNTATSGGTTNVVIGGVSNVTDRAWAVACLNETNGQAIWVRGVGAQSGGGNGNPYATGVVDDVPRLAVSGTNVFLTGAAYGPGATFGALTVNFGSLRGQYFARYDTNGNAQVAITYGSVTTTPVAAVADANGNVYVSGDFDGYSSFDNDIIAAPAEVDPFLGTFSQAFLAKFDRNGNALWARAAVSPATVNFLGIALASDGVWASGWGHTATNILDSFPPPVVFGTINVSSDYQYFPLGLFGGTYTSNPGGMLAKITDSAAVGLPVAILNPQDNGVNFQLSFQTQSGFTHAVQYRTNLVLGIWQTYSNVTGDGTLKTIPVPLSLFNPSKQGFVRVSTQ